MFKYKIEVLNEKIKEYGNKIEFCKQCDISLKTLNNILLKKSKLRISTAYKILKALNLNFFDLIVLE